MNARVPEWIAEVQLRAPAHRYLGCTIGCAVNSSLFRPPSQGILPRASGRQLGSTRCAVAGCSDPLPMTLLLLQALHHREHQMCSGWMFRPPSHDPAAASGATPPTPSTSSPCMALGAWPASSAPPCSQPHKSVHSTALPASLPARKMRSGRRWRSSWSCLSTSSSSPTSACGPPIGSSALRFQASPECVGIHSQEHPGPKLFKSDNFAGEGLWLHSCLHGCLQLNQTVCNFIIISMRRPVPSSKPASSPSC